MIKDKLYEIVKPYLMEGFVPTENSFLIDDLGFDSLDVVDIIIEVEEAFDIQITDNEIKELKTIAVLISLIELKLKEKKNDD